VALAEGPSLDAFLARADELGLPFVDVHVGRHGTSATIPLLNLPDWSERRLDLARVLGAASLEDDLALVSVVGDGLLGAAGLTRFARALADAGVDVRSRSGHALRLSALVPRASRPAAERALHAAFLGR
jgi:aspartokinase